MKFIYSILIVMILAFSSCQENEEPVISLANQTLIGTFERMVGNEPGQVADVTIRFENNTFEGNSNMHRYPAICNGTYEVTDNKINFNNACFFTADFDWTLILNGEFTISKLEDKVTLTKEIGTGSEKITDVYTFDIEGNQHF